MIRLSLVEDDSYLLNHLARLLEREEDIEVVSTAISAEEAIKTFEWNRMDVLLVDLDLPGASGVDLIAYAKEINPSLLAMVHTIYEDRETVFSAIRAGASGYILKGSTALKMASSIREMLAGGSPISPTIASRLIQEFQHQTEEPTAMLSTRETKLLHLLAGGLIYKEIANELGISPHTVHSHISNIYGKLQAKSRPQAMRRARLLGYLNK